MPCTYGICRMILPYSGKLLLLFLLSHRDLSAQSNGSWTAVQLKYHSSRTSEFFVEAQLRSLKFYQDFHYYEFKGGFALALRPDCKISAGLGSFQTYGEGGDFVQPKNNEELRIWPQLAFTQQMVGLKLEHRYRMEARFTRTGYRNRFRYRVGISWPLIRKNEKPMISILAGNELFFTNREPFFERNRLQLGLEIKTGSNSQIQLAWLRQFDYKINDETGRSFLQLAWYLDFFPQKGSSSPAQEPGEHP